MIESSIIPSRRTAFAGIVAITAGFVCFLLFTGLAFLDLAATVAGGADRLQLFAAVLGRGGSPAACSRRAGSISGILPKHWATPFGLAAWPRPSRLSRRCGGFFSSRQPPWA
jgi:hypothetical protein